MPIPDPTLVAATSGRQGDFLVWFDINPTISVVALSLGLLIFVIAYFAGGRENRAKLWMSIALSIVISILAMPLFIKLGKALGLLDSKPGEIFILFLLMIFIAGLSSHIYEIITVSAKEARPD
jgi:hypothetical protein